MAKDSKQLQPGRSLQCVVYFLDDSEAEFEIEKREKAQVLLTKVFDHLDISERKYFGLQFIDATSPEDNVSGFSSDTELMRWVDPAKSLKKQVKAFPPYYFFFRVKFYVPDPDCLVEEYTRYYFFLQLNKDLMTGKLKAPLQDVITLSGLAVQSELGDHNPDDQSTDYLYGVACLTDHSDDFLKKVAAVHRKLKSLRPAVCEKKYLTIVKNLDGYGVNLYKATLDQTNEEIQLGVTSQGLVMFKNDHKLNTFNWAKIVKLSFKRRLFFIHLHKQSPLDDTTENVYGFHMACYRTCKNLWKSCVEHHTFFCLHAQPSQQSSDSSSQAARQSVTDLSQPSSKELTSKMTSFSSSLHRDSPKYDSLPSSSATSMSHSSVSSATFNPTAGQSHGGTVRVQPVVASQPLNSANQQLASKVELSYQQQQQASKFLARSDAFRSSPVLLSRDGPGQQSLSYKTTFQVPSSIGTNNNNSSNVDNNNDRLTFVDFSPALSSSSSGLHNGGSTKDSFSSPLNPTSQVSFSSSSLLRQQNPVNNNSSWSDVRFADSHFNNTTSMTDGGRVVLREERQSKTLSGRSFATFERRRTFESKPAGCHNDDEISEEEDGQIIEKSTANVITTLSPVVLVSNSKQSDGSEKHNRDGQKIPRNSSNNCLEGLKTVRMKPDKQGRFGFNVKGGADLMQPIVVSRVAPDSPAGQCVPKLSEGDHVLFINGRDVSQHTHAQVVQFIRASREIHSGELVLVVRPMVYSNDMSPGEPDFQYIPDTHHIAALLNPGEDKLAASITQLKESIESKAGILQFEQLYRKKAGMCMTVSQMPENLPRNRYRDISPYDLTRVKLLSTPHDYINATFVDMNIPGTNLVNHYIATQGPLPDTTADFWSMIYEQASSLVVMLTVTEERGHLKCHKYWPDLGVTMNFKDLDLSVTCLSESSPCPSFVCRYLVLHVGPDSQEHHVHQMQYVAWPDHGVPDDCTDFLDFVTLVRQTRKGVVEPTVVHCSAGIGRTGVLIAMETAMCMIEADQPVHMLEIVRQMRDQRAMLIQTSSQFKFVCEAVIKVYDEKFVVPSKEYSC